MFNNKKLTIKIIFFIAAFMFLLSGFKDNSCIFDKNKSAWHAGCGMLRVPTGGDIYDRIARAQGADIGYRIYWSRVLAEKPALASIQQSLISGLERKLYEAGINPEEAQIDIEDIPMFSKLSRRIAFILNVIADNKRFSYYIKIANNDKEYETAIYGSNTGIGPEIIYNAREKLDHFLGQNKIDSAI